MNKESRLPVAEWERIINTAIKSGIEETVNGKIRRLDEKIDAYIDESKKFREEDKLHKKKVNDHIEKSELESKAIQPLLKKVVELSNVGEAVTTANNLSRFFKWVSGLGALGAALTWFYYKF